MIQNIQFPEGTQVIYQKGGVYDQFNKNINIKTAITSSLGISNGWYTYSNLYSAKEFINMQMDYCFYGASCIFRVKDTKSLFHTFENGEYPYDLIFDKNIPVNLNRAFNTATMRSFFTISAKATNIDNILGGSSLTIAKYINWDTDTSELTSISTPFTHYIKALFGLFSIKKLGNIKYYTITGYSNCEQLRHITISDIGTNSSQTSVDFSKWIIWGVNHTSLPDSRQSLIDSLITYSFDRAAAGYRTCTIKLAPKTKALLTEEEIAQITAKGYTIS